MLDYDWHIRFNHTGIIRITRNGRWIFQIIETHMFGPARRNGNFIWPHRRAIGIKNPYLHLGVASAGVQDARRPVTQQGPLRPLTFSWNIAFRNYPTLVAQCGKAWW